MIEKQMYDLLSRIFGKHKGVLLVVILVLGFGYPAGSDILQHIFTTGEEAPEWAQTINDNFAAIEATLVAIEQKIGFVQGYILEDQVKKINKQYDKIMDNPTDVYLIDLQTIVDKIWPGIPDEAKTVTLQQKYQVIEDKYNELLGAGFV